jgi:hypothetical protein
MMYRKPSREILAELRNALQVMEENAHLGLDDKAADKLKALLLRRIAKVEDVIAREAPSAPPNTNPIAEATE